MFINVTTAESIIQTTINLY